MNWQFLLGFISGWLVMDGVRYLWRLRQERRRAERAQVSVSLGMATAPVRKGA